MGVAQQPQRTQNVGQVPSGPRSVVEVKAHASVSAKAVSPPASAINKASTANNSHRRIDVPYTTRRSKGSTTASVTSRCRPHFLHHEAAGAQEGRPQAVRDGALAAVRSVFSTRGVSSRTRFVAATTSPHASTSARSVSRRAAASATRTNTWSASTKACHSRAFDDGAARFCSAVIARGV